MSTRSVNLKTLKKPKKKFHTKFSVKTFFCAYVNAIRSRTLCFSYPFLSSSLAHAFLKCLEKNSRIAGYKFFAEYQKAKIFLSYDSMSRKPLLPKITYYSSQGRTRIATVKILQEFAKKTPNSLTLISTNRGVMSLKDCLFYQCGGEFLVSLT